MSSFDNVHEWADFISFLKQLLKVRAQLFVLHCYDRACCLPDVPIVPTVQGNTAQARCSEAIISMLKPCTAKRSTPEGTGRVHAHIRCSRGAYRFRLAVRLENHSRFHSPKVCFEILPYGLPDCSPSLNMHPLQSRWASYAHLAVSSL